MLFSYKAKESNGKIIEGEIEAADQKSAITKLKDQKLVVVSLNPAKKKKKKKGKVSQKEIVIFSRQLSTLVSSGVQIVQGLNILEGQKLLLLPPS